MDSRQYIISFLATIKGNKAVVSGLKQIEKQTGKLTPAMGKATGAMKGMNKGLGGIMARAMLTIPVWLALRTAIMGVIRTIGTIIKSQRDLQDGLARIKTVLHGTSEEIEKAMTVARTAIIDMALKSDKSLKELAEAFYFLQTSALTSEQALSAFTPTINAMIGTGTNAKEMARAVAGAFNTMASSMDSALTDAEKFNKIADVLTFTFATQDVEMSELVQGYSKLAPFVTGLDDSFETLITILGTLNTKLLRGGRTGRLLGRTILQLTKNSDKLGRIFGITFQPDQPINFLKVIKQINTMLGSQGRITASQQKSLQEIFATRGAVAPKLLLQDFQDIESALIRVTNESEGFAEKIAEIRLRTVTSQGKRFVNILSAITSEFIDGGGFGDKLAISIKEMNDNMEKGAPKARSYGEALAETIANYKALDEAIKKSSMNRKTLGMENLFGLITPTTIETAKKLYKGYIDFIAKHSQKISERTLGKEFKDIKKETKETIDLLNAERDVIDNIDGKTKESKASFEQIKFQQDAITQAQKIQLSLLKVLGASEFDILQVKEQQLLANWDIIEPEKRRLELGKLQLEQQQALTKENEKQLGTLRSLAVRFEKASGLDKGRIYRLMELVQFDPEDLIRQMTRSQGDKNIILENLSNFNKEQTQAISDYILELRNLPGLDKLKEQTKLKAETMDLKSFMKSFETQTPIDFWNNWITKGQEAVSKFRDEFQKVSGTVSATATGRKTPTGTTPQGYVINSEGVKIEIGDIIVNAESKQDIEKTATDAIIKKIRGDSRFQKIFGDSLSDDV